MREKDIAFKTFVLIQIQIYTIGIFIMINIDADIDEDNCVNLCDFGYSYQHPDFPKGTAKAKNILAGSFIFDALKIEVFVDTN